MVLIETGKFKTFDEYIASLSDRARQEWRYVKKTNADLTYQNISFDKEKIKRFMEIWQVQLVRGKPIAWGYPIEKVEEWQMAGRIILFEAKHQNGETFAAHFLLKQDGFWETQPPMWDKAKMIKRHLGTWMWFNMVKYGIENGLGVLNMGGGIEESWREMLRRRKEFTNPKYKFRFIPKLVKENPDAQTDFRIEGAFDQRKLCQN